MASNLVLSKSRDKFLQENPMFTEIELTNELKPVGKLDEFDLLENEIWLMQCPKDMNVTELQNQKLKIPGRSNINSSEVVSMEFDKGKECHAFAYVNKKGRYDLRLLPVRGTIVVRDCLKAVETVTEERVEECFPTAKRVPMPRGIRARHPLLGVKYEDNIKLHKSIEKRLQKADEISAQILKEILKRKSERKLDVGHERTRDKQAKPVPPIEIHSADDDDDAVEFVSIKKLKQKKKKNKCKELEGTQNFDDVSKAKNSHLNTKSVVSEDLQWLQSI